MLKHVILDSGDAALIVQDVVVMTADPVLDKPDHVEMVAEKLSEALGVPLMRVQRKEPDSDDWTWEGLAEELAVDEAAPELKAHRDALIAAGMSDAGEFVSKVIVHEDSSITLEDGTVVTLIDVDEDETSNGELKAYCDSLMAAGMGDVEEDEPESIQRGDRP